MAGPDDDSDKTEEPTQRKLEQAHEQGDVIKSMEVSTFFGLVAVTAVIGLTGTAMTGALLAPLRGLIEHAAEIAVDGGGLRRLYLASSAISPSIAWSSRGSRWSRGSTRCRRSPA